MQFRSLYGRNHLLSANCFDRCSRACSTYSRRFHAASYLNYSTTTS